jgi:hypothetical protein
MLMSPQASCQQYIHQKIEDTQTRESSKCGGGFQGWPREWADHWRCTAKRSEKEKSKPAAGS